MYQLLEMSFVGRIGQCSKCAECRGPKLGLEKLDGEPIVGSPLEPLLVDLGFRSSPRRLTLSA